MMDGKMICFGSAKAGCLVYLDNVIEALAATAQSVGDGKRAGVRDVIASERGPRRSEVVLEFHAIGVARGGVEGNRDRASRARDGCAQCRQNDHTGQTR